LQICEIEGLAVAPQEAGLDVDVDLEAGRLCNE
jgi:hypothetical protein